LKYGGPAPTIRIRVRSTADGVETAVEDDGVGFDPRLKDQLFDPFRRAADNQDGVHHGTGLGLAIAKALVERMGGRIRAEGSGVGRGSRFTVTLQEVGG